MGTYILRRLLLLPLTLFCILLTNFVIINLAPGDPTTVTEISPEGNASRKEGSGASQSGDLRYLQFRERYGLTLPILLNTWVFLTQEDVSKTLSLLDTKNGLSVKDESRLKTLFGDQAKFVMPKILRIIKESQGSLQKLAVQFFVRGGTRQAIVDPNLDEEEKAYNQNAAASNLFLQKSLILPSDSPESISKKVEGLSDWYQKNAEAYEPKGIEKIKILFFETRIFRYMSRVLTLDFGSMRNDPNNLVTSEVVKRFKYSLTLSLIPMMITLVLCQVFGFLMAYYHHRFLDHSLNLLFLFLYAVPVFVVAPFLIEKVGLHHFFPFTNIPIPISGFTSRLEVYESLTSWQRFIDTLEHLFLPLIAILYGGLAAQTRLSKTAVLEVLRQDYVTAARAKGVSSLQLMTRHVGPNAAITIVTSVAGSLGVVLGGSLIVETLFDINGFGKFFYDAVINRDYNVIMFSAIAGSFLTLIGYLVADLCYMFLDPRVTLD